MPDVYNTALLPIQWFLERVQDWTPGYTLMKLFSFQSAAALAFAAQSVNVAEAKNGFDVFKYVDPLIGTSNGGEHQRLQDPVA